LNAFKQAWNLLKQKNSVDYSRLPKADLAMMNALANLGYPIFPKTPTTPTKNRLFPTEQEEIRTHHDPYFSIDYENDEDVRNDLEEIMEQQDKPLGYALGLGNEDFDEVRDEVGYDSKGNMKYFAPTIHHTDRIRNLGRTLQQMTGPIGNNEPQITRNDKQVFQDFKQVDPLQFDKFNQAYLNRNQFKPFYEAEKVLFNNPQSFGRNAPNEGQIQQLREDFNLDDAEYRDIGSALQFMNTPTEQKRLFEFGDTPHAERYREMLSSLNQDQ
jgi:hypothetical protein|tara:strand:+ start:803 stop:1612 length:810 start_codon:yes stop_codon:yes gene_type:complete